MFEYVEATIEKLNEVWDLNIKKHSDDPRWIRWKQQFIQDNLEGKAKTFLVLKDGYPIGEGSLLFSVDCRAIKGRRFLADGKYVTNINGLRIIKAYEGQGHISKLVKEMESYARKEGYTLISIGVEDKEERNKAIYHHWGYRQLVHSEIEDGELVLYYQKHL